MKNKRSYKVLWNVFLFVICGGSLIYGFVQQQRRTEASVQLEECQQRVDSLKMETEKLNQQLNVTLQHLQIERDVALSAINKNRN